MKKSKIKSWVRYFRCPKCKGELTQIRDSFVCNACQIEYTIVEGVPDLVLPSNYSITDINIVDKYENFGKIISRTDAPQEIQRKKTTVDLVHGNAVLEIGCAEGWMTNDLAKKEIDHLFSCDISMSYLKRAKKKNIDSNFIRMDAHNIPFPDEFFDCVIVTAVLEHLVAPYKALEEINRVLKQSGTLILVVPNNMGFRNIIGHLLRRYKQTKSAHINSYDVFSMLDLLKFTRFKPEIIKTFLIDLPLPLVGRVTNGIMDPFLQHNLLVRIFPYFGKELLITAKKVDETLWDSL